jgi:hypothetical protein
MILVTADSPLAILCMLVVVELGVKQVLSFFGGSMK